MKLLSSGFEVLSPFFSFSNFILFVFVSFKINVDYMHTDTNQLTICFFSICAIPNKLFVLAFWIGLQNG